MQTLLYSLEHHHYDVKLYIKTNFAHCQTVSLYTPKDNVPIRAIQLF